MKTRKCIAYILTVAALLSLLAGCGKQANQPSMPSGNSNIANQNTESNKATESNQTTEATKATESNQATNATEATGATEVTDATESDCIHILGAQWTVTERATCTNEGSRYKTCVLCGDKVAEKIAKLDHEPGTWKQVKGKDATCSQEGQQYQACRQCEEIIIYINTEKKPHTPNALGTKCTVCGEAIPKN